MARPSSQKARTFRGGVEEGVEGVEEGEGEGEVAAEVGAGGAAPRGEEEEEVAGGRGGVRRRRRQEERAIVFPLSLSFLFLRRRRRRRSGGAMPSLARWGIVIVSREKSAIKRQKKKREHKTVFQDGELGTSAPADVALAGSSAHRARVLDNRRRDGPSALCRRSSDDDDLSRDAGVVVCLRCRRRDR